jgi:ketosteroid isomerase-like protein
MPPLSNIPEHDVSTETDEPFASLRKRLDRIESVLAITELLYKYARGVDRGDAPLLKEVYHPDAIDVHAATFVGNGFEFADYITNAMKSALTNRHVVTNPLIEINGDKAFVESQFLATSRIPRGEDECIDMYSEGRYLDVFERRENVWKMLHRVVVHEKFNTFESSRKNTNPEQPTGIQASVSGGSDPSYLGFDIQSVRPDPFVGPDPLARFLES